MDFRISPLRGVGPILFGMSPEEVRRGVGGDFRTFERSLEAPSPCDYFMQLGTYFYYDLGGELEAVEFAPPSRPTINGQRLLGVGFEEAISTLSSLDDQVEKELDAATAYRLGVSIWAPLAKEDVEAPVESVLAFRAGYYDQALSS